MGTISIAWAAGLRCIGAEPYIPPYTSKETLSLGIKYSPEAICMPYKLILGNFIQAIEGGADYVAMISSPGTCRMGEYSKGIEFVLGELGYKTKFIELQLYDGIKGIYDFFCKLSGKSRPITFLYAIYIFIKKIFVQPAILLFPVRHDKLRTMKKESPFGFGKEIEAEKQGDGKPLRSQSECME